MRARVWGAMAIVAAVGSTVSSCNTSTISDAQNIVFPDTAVSYQQHVNPFLSISCGQCHGSVNPAGGIRLTSYSNLFFDRPNLVVPGKPDESLLVQVLERQIAHPVGNIEQVPSNHIRGTRTWISEGAENN